MALEACEGLLQESVKLEADDVRVTLEGSVVVAQSAERAEPDEAARSLVSVLARLLVAAGPGVPPYLLQLVKETTTGQRSRDLRHLHDAIEASLIPINRGASRRVLARLVRESDRPPAPEVPQIDPHELDAELDELLRDPISRTLEPTQTKLPLQEEEDEEPITERIRIPRAVTRGTDPVEPTRSAGHGASALTLAPKSLTRALTLSLTLALAPTLTPTLARHRHGPRTPDTDAVTDTAPVSFPPPVPDFDLQPETVPVPPSEPARKAASVPVPDLQPPPAPTPAAAAPAIREQPSQPRPEPVTATIRKWPRKEDAAQPPRGFASESEIGPGRNSRGSGRGRAGDSGRGSRSASASARVRDRARDRATESVTEPVAESESATEPVSPWPRASSRPRRRLCLGQGP